MLLNTNPEGAFNSGLGQIREAALIQKNASGFALVSINHCRA